jgi:hypothetical protein
MPTERARIADLRDAAAAVLAATSTPETPVTVASTWLARLSFDEDDPDQLTSGRRLYVLAAMPQLSALARGYWKNGYTLGVVFVERYTDAGDPPDEWVDGVVKWWEQNVLFPLCAPDLVLTGPAGLVTEGRPDPETPPEVTTFVDRDLLTECKAVLIACNFAYIDATDHTGAA